MNTRLAVYRGNYFFFYAAGAAIMAFAALYFHEALSFNNAQVGIITSTYSVTTIFCQPFWGMMADSTGNPKRISIVLMLISIALALSLLYKGPFVLIFATYLVFSFFYGGIAPLFDSMTMDYLSRRPDVSFGQIRFLGSIGFSVSALAVGYVIDMTSLNAIFIIFSLMFAATLVFTVRMENVSTIGKGSFREDFKSLLRIREFWLVTLFLSLLLGSMYGPGTYLGLFLLEKGYTAKSVGLIFFLMAGLEVPFMIYARKIILRFSFYKMIIAIALISSLRLYALSLDIGIIPFLAVSATASLVIGLILPSVVEHVSSIVPKGVLSTSVSIYTAASFGLGVWCMTLIGGLMSDSIGYAAMFRYFSFFSLTAVLLAVVMSRKFIKN